MANSPSARKRVRQNATRRTHNGMLRSKGRTAIKRVQHAIENKHTEQVADIFKQAQSILDSLVNKGIFSKNKVARHKSRLNKQIKLLNNK